MYMNNIVTLEGAKLKQIADKNETSTLVMLSLADRKRFRAFTDISHLKNIYIRSGEKIVLEDYMNTWKELETLGVGSVIHGRKGQPTRFKWNYSLRTIGEAALSGKDVQVRALETSPKILGKVQKIKRMKQKRPVLEKTQEIMTHTANNILYIRLRDDFSFSVKVPADLTSQEINNICEAFQKIG